MTVISTFNKWSDKFKDVENTVSKSLEFVIFTYYYFFIDYSIL